MYIYDKNKTIELLKSLKKRYGMRNKDWAGLLGLDYQTYINAVYHNAISGDTCIQIYESIDLLIKNGVLKMTIDELKLLVWNKE